MLRIYWSCRPCFIHTNSTEFCSADFSINNLTLMKQFWRSSKLFMDLFNFEKSLNGNFKFYLIVSSAKYVKWCSQLEHHPAPVLRHGVTFFLSVSSSKKPFTQIDSESRPSVMMILVPASHRFHFYLPTVYRLPFSIVS